MVSLPLSHGQELEPPPPVSAGVRLGPQRLSTLTTTNFQFIWRSLRRLGLRDDQVDDAAQQVFEVAARRFAEINVGSERAFLFKTAILVATEHRRLDARSRQLTDGSDPDGLPAGQPDPETATGMLERRRLLDAVLDAMPLDLRTVFVLFDGGLDTRELPSWSATVGTAASACVAARRVSRASSPCASSPSWWRRPRAIQRLWSKPTTSASSVVGANDRDPIARCSTLVSIGTGAALGVATTAAANAVFRAGAAVIKWLGIGAGGSRDGGRYRPGVSGSQAPAGSTRPTRTPPRRG
jgi:DNA-directed RNA polymerase specialized sigma24 family protein